MKHPVDTSQWGEFVVGELFELTGIKQVKSQHHVLEDPDGIPFVIQSNKNNMVKMKANKQWLLDNDEPVVEGNAIVLGVTLPVVSYQPYEFGTSQVITARSEHLNELRGLFITSVINSFVIPKYSYVYKPGIQKYKQDVIPLPLKPSANPSNYTQEDIDWDYMETVMSRVTARAKERLASLPQPTDKKKTPVNTSAWGEFAVGELFECNTTKTFYPNKSELPPGNTPYITRSTYDNGISDYYDDIDNEFTIEGNCLTIGAEGGIAFWQPKPFIAGVKVYTIRHPQLNELTALFVASLLNANSANYSYTNARVLAKIKAESIKLPLKSSADPSNFTQEDIDWNYMENFMKIIEEKAHDRLKSLQKTIA